MFLISDLAEHTRNLRADARGSLLVAENAQEDPLANGRVTLIGDCSLISVDVERESARRVFLEAHPNARFYVDYKDFSFWKLRVESVRYIGGVWADVLGDEGRTGSAAARIPSVRTPRRSSIT